MFCRFHVIPNREVIEELKKPFIGSPEKLALINLVTQSVIPKLESQTEKRFIKTHLPLSLLPPDLLTKGCKVK